MKILRIQFENLNSLPSGDIDLTVPPLSEAGLFAITGPTGAGKSTILDAITLALYGRAARYNNAPNPEDMMSRRAASCLAEITFEVRGASYRARWQLRRARGQADGKVQPPQRHLYNAQGEVLAQGVNEVMKSVEELTGLTYDRFLRSALLAQGQFARFLMANETERALLLESLTGTEIYAELGRLAYRKATDKESELERRAALLNATALLTPEQRCALEAERIGKTETLKTLQSHFATCRQQLERGQALATHLRAEQQLCIEEAALLKEIEEATPERTLLARHRAGESFYQALGSVEHLAAQELSDARALEIMTRSTAQAEARANAACVALSRLYREESERLTAALLSLQQQKEVRAIRLAEIATDIAHSAAVATLDEQLPLLIEQIGHLSNLRESIARQQQKEATLSERIGTHQRQRETKEAGLAQSREKLQKLATALTEVSNTVANLRGEKSDEALQERSRRLANKESVLLELRAIMIRIEGAKTRGGELAALEGRTKEEIEEIRKQVEETEREAAAQVHLLQQAEQSLSRLMQMAGFDVQRSMLEPGTPCPLCGSKEHPDAHRAILTAEIEDARLRVETARNGHDTAVKEAELARLHVVQKEADLTAIRRHSAELRQQQTEDHERFATQARTLKIYTLESLDGKRIEHDEERKAWEERLRDIRDAERRKAEAELSHARGLHEEALLATELASHDTATLELQEQLAHATRERIHWESSLPTLLEEITSLLSPFALAAPASGEETATRKALEERQRAYRALLTEQTKLERDQLAASTTEQSLSQTLADTQERALRLGKPPIAAEDIVETYLKTWADSRAGVTAVEAARTESTALSSRQQEQTERLAKLHERLREETRALEERLSPTPFSSIAALREARLAQTELQTLQARIDAQQSRRQTIDGRLSQLREQIVQLREMSAPEGEALATAHTAALESEQSYLAARDALAALDNELAQDARRAAENREALDQLQRDREKLAGWRGLKELIGGGAFQKFAQGLTLDVLLRHANTHLSRLTDRYRLQRAAKGELQLEIVDLHQAGAVRPAASLSGGESFLASLALALGLSDLAGRNIRIDSLFIDEGFGSLDPETLDVALSALEVLRLSQKTIGVISHVELLKERITVQIVVEKQAGGESRLRLRA